MNTHSPITLQSTPVLAWSAPTHPKVERTKRWYIGAGCVVAVTAVYGIVSGSWSLAIVSVLAGGMYALIHDHAHADIRIEIHDSGILLNGVFTRWDELHGYWILHTPAYDELRFVLKKPRMRMVIQTGTHAAAELRMILGQRLPELAHMHESIIDTFIRICKL